MQSKMKILECYCNYCIYQVTNDYIYHDDNNNDYVKTNYNDLYIKLIRFKHCKLKYFICPDCKRLYIYLYLVDNEIKCRKCHNLYYESQLYNDCKYQYNLI
jgi:hypothetical protein